MGQMPQDHRISADDRPALLRQVHARLCEAYHCPIAYFHALDPLDYSQPMPLL